MTSFTRRATSTIPSSGSWRRRPLPLCASTRSEVLLGLRLIYSEAVPLWSSSSSPCAHLTHCPAPFRSRRRAAPASPPPSAQPSPHRAGAAQCLRAAQPETDRANAPGHLPWHADRTTRSRGARAARRAGKAGGRTPAVRPAGVHRALQSVTERTRSRAARLFLLLRRPRDRQGGRRSDQVHGRRRARLFPPRRCVGRVRGGLARGCDGAQQPATAANV